MSAAEIVADKQTEYHYVFWHHPTGRKAGWRAQSKVQLSSSNTAEDSPGFCLRFSVTSERWPAALAWGADSFHGKIYKELHKVGVCIMRLHAADLLQLEHAAQLHRHSASTFVLASWLSCQGDMA